MINKRLINMAEDNKKYIALNVLLQWISLIANIAIMAAVSGIFFRLYNRENIENHIVKDIILIISSLVIRFLCSLYSAKMSYLSSESVKMTLREKIYKKLLKLGASYNEKVKTSEAVQVAVEGVDQLETYFGSYLPQFFYAMLAPVTLFIFLSFINLKSAVILLICVPLIPVSIAAVQTFAKKLLSKYWGQYTTLGNSFLENLQVLTTLKIYKADEFKNEEMNREEENFRKITMKVLVMQLNSITIMDLIAYGGAALGAVMAVTEFKSGNVNLYGCILIIMLSADFFIPMRLLGSFFHIAMNGMEAGNKIFKILDMPEEKSKEEKLENDFDITISDLVFSYDKDNEVIKKARMKFPKGSFTAIAGKSGCGKSTIASLLMGKNKNYIGSIKIGNKELRDISEKDLMKNITYISHQSYIFKGTVRENLLMGKIMHQKENLLCTNETYRDLWNTQQNLEMYGTENNRKEKNKNEETA